MTGPTPTSPTGDERRLRRRTVLVGGLLAASGVISGCGAHPEPVPADAPTPPPAPPDPLPEGPRPTVPAPEPVLLADVPSYTVLPGEVEPECKQAAVAFVTAVLTTGTPGTTTPLEDRLAALGQVMDPAGPLLGLLPVGGASALEVVYPQYGGLDASCDEASVMLVADQLLVPGGSDLAVQRRSTTLDVRLRKDDRWRVHEVIPAVLPVPAPTLSPAVQELLANDRVVLPAAARADLEGGGVHDAVARALTELSSRWRLHVQVLSGGHPPTVWATTKVSNHVRGRAVDIWAVDGVPVVARTDCPWSELMLAGTAAGATEVGGPGDSRAGGHFTDHTHQDHVHLGFSRA